MPTQFNILIKPPIQCQAPNETLRERFKDDFQNLQKTYKGSTIAPVAYKKR